MPDGEMIKGIFYFEEATKFDPGVAAWFASRGELGALAERWFDVIRNCGSDVREVLHDGHPTACVGTAAFAYVNAFTAHVNIGFFRGAELPDPHRLLQGNGKMLRHIQIRPGDTVREDALVQLIESSYASMRDLIS